MQRQEEQIREASESAARAELLLQEEAGFLEAEGVEKTYNYRQDQLSKEVDINTSKKVNKGHRCMYGSSLILQMGSIIDIYARSPRSWPLLH